MSTETGLKNSFVLKTGTLEELNSIITQPSFKGTIANLPSHLYHTCAGISRSTLTDLDKSLSHYLERKKNPKEPTKDMVFGSAFHDYLMLPDEFSKNFAIEPSKNIDGLLETIEDLKKELVRLGQPTTGKKKEDFITAVLAANPDAKIWDVIKLNFEKSATGKQTITDTEFAKIKVMAKKVKSHPTIMALSSHKVIYEQSFFWQDPKTGKLCKCRPDVIFITPNLFLPGDWKTTDCAKLEAFQRTIGKFGYHIQAPYYLDGINIVLDMAIKNFMFIPVEKEAPHEPALYAIDEAAQDVGRSTYRRLMDILSGYEDCLEKSRPIWLGYNQEIQNISVPSYLFYQEA